MNIEKIKENITTKYIGRNIIYYETINSTQEMAKELAKQNIQNGSMLIADYQKKGLGTHGRTWFSEKNKNILMTILVYPNCTIDKLGSITKDIAQCLSNVTGKICKTNLDIKEPNDLILNDKKISGILTETRVEEELVKCLFIGIGINVNQEEFSEELIGVATSLKKELGKEFDREEIVIEFINNFENIIEEKIKSV